MKKTQLQLAVTLLSSMLLAACGGSDAPTNNSDDIAAGGVVVITSIDGYYKNGLLFLDVNNNGVLDLDIDTIFGLTDETGQYPIPEGTTGTLGLQTLIPDGDGQKNLITYDSTYAGIYTVDMDFPDQPVSSEIVLRAPATSTVISPVTDLVSILMVAGRSEEDAQNAVISALDLADGTDLYVDFVESADAELYKVAQILADSKAANSTQDYDDNVIAVAQAAAEKVDDIIAQDAIDDTSNLTDVTVSAVIQVDSSSSEEVAITTVSNVTAMVSDTVYDSLQLELDYFTLTLGSSTDFTSNQSLDSLIIDDDQSSIALSIQDAESDGSLTIGGITISITSDNKLSLSSSEVTATEDVSLVLLAEDQFSDGSRVSDVYVEFIINVNEAPTVNATTEASLAAIVEGWELVVGESFTQTLDFSELFEDPDGDTLSYGGGVTTTGLEVEISGSTFFVTGIPTESSENSTLIMLAVDDREGESVVELNLPVVIAVDSDNDGVDDYLDAFPNDATETVDSDEDGVGDNADAFDDDATETIDTDSDGIGNNADTDDDDDGVADAEDTFPLDASETVDTDNDGTGDNADSDADGNGVPDADEQSALIGTWSKAYNSFTFTETTYTHANLVGDDECPVGTEIGTYTYNETTGEFTPISMISNGDEDCGFYGVENGFGDDFNVTLTVAEDGNYLTLSSEEDDESYLFDLYKSLDTSAEDFVTANPNFAFLNIYEGSEGIDIEYESIQWSANLLTTTMYELDLDGNLVEVAAEGDDDEDYILTIEGWGYADYGAETLTPQGDGSMSWSDNVESGTITGVEWSLSGANIARFQESIGIEDSLLTYFDDSVTFSDGAALYVTTFVSTSEPVYSLWLDSCDDASTLAQISVDNTGYCNTQYYTDNGAAVTSIEQITASIPFADETDTSWGDFHGVYFNDYAIRLVDDGSNRVDVYNLDWENDSITFVSDNVTWQETTLYGYTFINFSTEDDSLSSFNQLVLTEVDGYVRGADMWGDSESDEDTEIMFNNIAAQDLLDAFDVSTSSSSATDTSTFSFTTGWLNGKTLYNVYLETDEGNEYWKTSVFTFTESEISAYQLADPDNVISGVPYTITDEGYITYDASYFGDSGDDYIRALSDEDEYLTLAWSSNIDDLINPIDYSEFFFYGENAEADAEQYILDNPVSSSSSTGRITYDISTGTVAFNIDGDTSVPDDAMVRIVPNSYSDIGDYSMALICDIDESGSFGTGCLIYDEQEADFNTVLADTSETYQFAIFKNHLNTDEYHWDCGEDVYNYVGGSVNSWWDETIVVTDSDYQDRSGETCSD